MNKKVETAMRTIKMPQRAVFLKPMRRYNLPENEEDSGQVILMLANINPAAIAPTSITDCAKTGINMLGPMVMHPMPIVARLAPTSTRFLHTHLGKMGLSARDSIFMVVQIKTMAIPVNIRVS